MKTNIYKKNITHNVKFLVLFAGILLTLTLSRSVNAQTYGQPLFVEDFGTVPAAENADTYRGTISGRGTIGNTYWFWPYTCSGTGWVMLSTPVREVSYANPLPAGEVGKTEWSFVQTSMLSGAPYIGVNYANSSYTWCLNSSSWTGPNPSSCSGTYMRWYQINGTWKLGYWERYRLRNSVACSSWNARMDDGGYALSTNPYFVHNATNQWHGKDGVNLDHTPGDVNGMMLVVNAAMLKGLFYKREITGLCNGAQFEFKSYYTNVLKTSSCSGNGIDINIRYEIWDKDPGDDEANSLIPVGGTANNGAILLADTNTGNVNETPTLTWFSTSLIFNVPQNQDRVFIILRNNGPGGCGNDLAIDDITFKPYIPFTIGYNANTTDYCTTEKITLEAEITSGAIPSALPYVFQWQVANQGTTNWSNLGNVISDFDSTDLVLNISDIGGKIYRIVSAVSEENFNNSNCFVASDAFDGNTVSIPTGTITATADVCGDVNHSPVNASFTVNYQGNDFPWTYYYKVNGGTEQQQTVYSPNVNHTKTLSITDNTSIELTKISTFNCTVNLNTVKDIVYSKVSPIQVVSVSGPNPGCIATEAQFSISGATVEATYTWVVSSGWEIMSGQGSNEITVKIGNTSTTFQVTAQNACGTIVYNSGVFETTNSATAAPATITTPSMLCFPAITEQGSANVLIECEAVNGAQNYVWEWDSTVTLGVQQSGVTGQYRRKIILSVPYSVTSFNVKVRTQNGCGYSTYKEQTFTPERLTTLCKDIELFLDDNGNASITPADVDNGSNSLCGIKSMSVFPNTFNCSDVGTHNVTLTVTDNNDNVAVCSSIVTVRDTIPPVLIVPADISVSTDENLYTASGVNLGIPTISDNCAIASITHNAPTVYAIGVTTVSWSATDVNGNTSYGTQNVSVEYVENPIVTFYSGSYIINMGIFTGDKTLDVKTQLKPYGCIFDLIKNHNVPVYWIINHNKVKDGTDFTYNGVNYKGGTYVIAKEYLSSAVLARIAYWNTQGVVGDFTTSPLTVNITYKLNSVPVWTLDAQNGPIASAFFTNAGIPASSYNWLSPSSLGPCNDIFVMPHADPVWATHGSLYEWNLVSRGAVWAGCHAISALENMYNPADRTQQTDFLAKRTGNYLGTNTYANNALVLWGQHANPSPPFITTNPIEMTFGQNFGPTLVSPNDPVAQYMNVSDQAHMNGSEQVVIPVKNGGWRSSTKIITYDPTHSDIPANSDGPAVLIAYGRAFGDANRGLVMYEAGHNINKGTVGDVPAQRAFFNWSMLATIDKAPVIISIDGIPSDKRFESLPYPQSYPMSIDYVSPMSSALTTVTWSCTRSDNGAPFGSFSPNGTASAVNTVFTPAITYDVDVPCIITVKVVDECGRTAFNSYPVIVISVPRSPVAKVDMGYISSTCALQGFSATVYPLNNDYDPDGDPLTVTNVSAVNSAEGTWSTDGTIITFLPALNFFGPTTATYTVCDNTPVGPPFFGPLCATSTVVIGVGSPDDDGCYPGSLYGIEGNHQVTLTNLVAQNGTGAILYAAPLNDTEGEYLSVGNDYLNMGTSVNNYIVLSTEKVLRYQDVVNLAWSKGLSGAASITIQVGQSETGPWTNPQTFSMSNTENGSDASTVSAYTLPVGVSGITHLRINAGTFPATNSSVNVWLDGVDYDYLRCMPVLPEAFPDYIDVLEDVPALIDVIRNDNNPGNLPLTLSVLTQPVNGKISINLDNSITYVNNTDYPTSGNGTDAFTYMICNSHGLCATGLVSITIINDDCAPGQFKSNGLATTTVTFQEGVLNSVEDTYLNRQSSTTNYGTSTTWVIGKRTSSSRRPIIRFNGLSSIPADAEIESAVFSMYETASSKSTLSYLSLSFHRITESWTETQTTWNKRNSSNNWASAGGSFTSSEFLTSVISNTKNEWKEFDITNMVQQWVKTPANNGFTNNGFLIKQTDEGISDITCTFASSENGTSSRRPMLTVTYNSPNSCAAIPNRPPLANPDVITTLSSIPVTIPVLANDSDPDNNPLTVVQIIGNPAGGNAVISANAIVFTPSGTYIGESYFLYVVQDNSGLKDTSYVKIRIQNTEPIANNDSVSVYSNSSNNVVDVLSNDVNNDGPFPISLDITTQPNHGTAIFSNNTIIYTPYQEFTGKDTLYYNYCEPLDSNLCTTTQICDEAMLVITVINQAPVPYNDNYTISPCFPFVMTVLDNDTDPENDILHVDSISALSKPSAGQLMTFIDGTVVYYPATGFIGEVSFTYTIRDNGNPSAVSNSAATVSIIVEMPVNTHPVALDDTLEMFYNNTDYISVLDNDYDPDGQTLAVPEIIQTPLFGIATVLPNGLIQYTPNTDFWGLDSFEYKICDIQIDDYLDCSSSEGLCDMAKVFIIVYKPNEKPTLFQATPPNLTLICKDYSPAAIITPGSGGGIGATDVYEFSKDGGISWQEYQSEAPINTAGASTSVLVRVSRTAGSWGVATDTTVIAKWIIAPPIQSPQLNNALPAVGTFICGGYNVSATITPGSGGSQGAADTYEFSVDNGLTWNPYTSGTPINTLNALAGIKIRVSRTGGDFGCSPIPPAVIAEWFIAPKPPAPTTQVTHPSCTEPFGSITFSGLPFSDWTIQPVGITNSTSSTVIPHMSPGTYTFTIKDNVSGCVSEQAVVTINPAPLPPQPVFVTGGGTLCGSGNVLLSAFGGSGGTIYWQGTTSGGTNISEPASAKNVNSTGTYYFRSRSNDGCWGQEGSSDVIVVEANSPYTPNERTVIKGILSSGGFVNTGNNATWDNQNWVKFDASGNPLSYSCVPTDTADVLIFRGECITPVVRVPNSGTCKNLTLSEGSTVILEPGKNLIIKGDLMNSGILNVEEGSDTAKGIEIIEITGNWNNEAGEFYCGKGKVIFNGNAIQEIDSRYWPFYNLEINQPGGKGGEVVLMEEITVLNILNLDNGQLNLNNNIVNIANKEPEAITRSNGYIFTETTPEEIQNVVRWHLQDNVNTYTIPFGKSETEYLPLSLELTKNSMDESGYIDFTTYSTSTYNEPMPIYIDHLGSYDNSMIADRYWFFGFPYQDEDVSAPFEGYITFTYLQSELDNILESSLIAQRYNPQPDSSNGVWGDMIYSQAPFSTWEVHGFCVNTPVAPGGNTGTFKTSYVDTAQFFNVWILGSEDYPLPIKLKNFNAQCNTDNVHISWTTATETNNDFFTVEKSSNGTDWLIVARVDGANNSSTDKHYALTDNNPLGVTSYYRLKQTDNNGKTELFNPQFVSCATEYGNQTVDMYPNPSSGILNISLNNVDVVNSKIILYDALGQQIYSGSLDEMPVNQGVYNLNMSNYADGMYYLKIVSDNYTHMEKVIKRK